MHGTAIHIEIYEQRINHNFSSQILEMLSQAVSWGGGHISIFLGTK